MSYGDGRRHGVRALFGASWKQVLVQLEEIQQCVFPVPGRIPSGGWTPFVCKSEFGLASDNSLLR